MAGPRSQCSLFTPPEWVGTMHYCIVCATVCPHVATVYCLRYLFFQHTCTSAEVCFRLLFHLVLLCLCWYVNTCVHALGCLLLLVSPDTSVVLTPPTHRFSFASASPDNIKIWKFPDGNFLQNFTGHQSIVNTLAMNSDNVLVSGGAFATEIHQ